MPSTLSIVPEKLLQTIAEAGPFAAGSVFGGLLSTGMHWLASKERMERAKLDIQREQELIKQNALKDKRIDALHEMIAANHPHPNTSPTTPKKKA